MWDAGSGLQNSGLPLSTRPARGPVPTSGEPLGPPCCRVSLPVREAACPPAPLAVLRGILLFPQLKEQEPRTRTTELGCFRAAGLGSPGWGPGKAGLTAPPPGKAGRWGVGTPRWPSALSRPRAPGVTRQRPQLQSRGFINTPGVRTQRAPGTSRRRTNPAPPPPPCTKMIVCVVWSKAGQGGVRRGSGILPEVPPPAGEGTKCHCHPPGCDLAGSKCHLVPFSCEG